MRESTRDTGALIWPQGRSQSPGMFCSMKSHCRSAKALNLNPLCHLTTRISNSYLLGEFLLIRITVALLIKIKQSSILMVVSTSSSISRIGCRLSYTRVVQQSTSIITMHSWSSFAVQRGEVQPTIEATPRKSLYVMRRSTHLKDFVVEVGHIVQKVNKSNASSNSDDSFQ